MFNSFLVFSAYGAKTKKGNIMDKKILLGGAAALLLVGNMYATPASASIDLSISGDAKVTAGFSACGVTAPGNKSLEAALEEMTATAQIGAAGTATTAELNAKMATINAGAGAAAANSATDAQTAGVAGSFLLTTVVANAADTVEVTAGAPTAAQAPLSTILVAKADPAAFTYGADPCGDGVDRNGIDWGFGKKLYIDASGTLANGLSVSVADEIDLTDVDAEEGRFSMTLGGAFGSLNFKNGGGDAVAKARVAGDADYDVNGTNIGFHGSKTTGHGGMGILWTAPSVGDLDLYVGWSPNSGGDGLDNAKYENTFSVAAAMDVTGLNIGVGYATANATDGNGCAAVATAEFNGGTLVALGDTLYGGDYCGDQTLMHVAASMDAGEISLGAGYSTLDTDEADKTVMHIEAGTSMGGYDLTLGYRQTTKDYEFGGKEDKQSVIAAGISTSLGDGVDLGLSLTSSDVDLMAETNNTAANNGDNSLMFAEVSLSAAF
jgi:hypothetical protein